MPLRQSAFLAGAFLFMGCASSTESTSTFSLTVNNKLSWCTVSVLAPTNVTLPNGGTATTNTITLAAGTIVSLHAEPGQDFIWASSSAQGGWSGDLDVGTDPISKTIAVTLTSNKTVAVCCPFPSGTGC